MIDHGRQKKSRPFEPFGNVVRVVCRQQRFVTGREQLLHNLKLKLQFLATKNIRQIELPKFSREAKSGPALVEIGQPLKTE